MAALRRRPLMRPRWLAVALVLAVPPAVSIAAPPTFEQSLSLMSGRAPRISPDGRAVVYERQETDWKENAYVTQLFLADVASGKSVQLTRGKKPATSAEWSPDGRWIAFLTERDGVVAPKDPDAKDKDAAEAKPDARQIWVIAPAGGEAWPLTAHGAHIDTFHWSKAGQSIPFIAPAPEAN